ncbi:hypothetical protein [uncultured Limosilactobacillus sp.]|uniref:hypothetical protein n=1 Tax=uncultured Limosilactobacillus sp. TaxID=2837629 RepID=UPI0025FCF88E|nr:hypothetical protein [uncultured Limosilactobacillus sp.]
MRKTKSLVTYNLLSWGIFIKWFLIWLIGFNLLFVVIGLFTHGFSMEGATGGWGALGVQILQTIEGVTILATFAYAFVAQYSEFKMAIHGGVSRETMWKAHLATLAIGILASWIFWMIADFCSSRLDHTTIFNPWYVLLTLLFFALSFNALGSMFALFNRRGKIILVCALIAGFVAFVMLMAQLVIHTASFWENLVMNLSRMGTTGISIVGWVIYALWILFTLWLSYFCSKRLQLRRD